MSTEQKEQTQANPGDVLYAKSETETVVTSEENVSEVPADETVESTEEESDSNNDESQEVEEVDYSFEKPENSHLDDESLDMLKEFAKKHKLSNETAQEFLAQQNEALNSLVSKAQEKRQQQIAQWAIDSKNDPEIGGEKFVQSVEFTRRTVEAFADDKFKQLLNETGYGNHPQVIKFLSSIGAKFENDKFVDSNERPVQEQSAADILYGTKK